MFNKNFAIRNTTNKEQRDGTIVAGGNLIPKQTLYVVLKTIATNAPFVRQAIFLSCFHMERF